MNQNTKQQEKADQEVFLTHVFNANREMVFAAWTDPEQLLKWFAPEGCSISYSKLDIQDNGTYHSCIHDPVHGECWCKGTYLEITFPEKIVYTIEMTDRNESDLNSINTGKDEEWPSKTTLTVKFKELDGKTLLSLHQTVSEKLANRTGALPSWKNMLERLSLMLENEFNTL